MNEKVVKCDNCGYERIKQLSEDFECGLCGSNMSYLEPKNHTITNVYVEAFKQDIEFIGNKKTHLMIEAFTDALTRIKYRHFFFSAGGVVPHSEIKI